MLRVTCDSVVELFSLVVVIMAGVFLLLLFCGDSEGIHFFLPLFILFYYFFILVCVEM